MPGLIWIRCSGRICHYLITATRDLNRLQPQTAQVTGAASAQAKVQASAKGLDPVWGLAKMETPAAETILAAAAAVAERMATRRVRTSIEYFVKPKSPRARE
jgi:hypothetical protein